MGPSSPQDWKQLYLQGHFSRHQLRGRSRDKSCVCALFTKPWEVVWTKERGQQKHQGTLEASSGGTGNRCPKDTREGEGEGEGDLYGNSYEISGTPCVRTWGIPVFPERPENCKSQGCFRQEEASFQLGFFRKFKVDFFWGLLALP